MIKRVNNFGLFEFKFIIPNIFKSVSEKPHFTNAVIVRIGTQTNSFTNCTRDRIMNVQHRSDNRSDLISHPVVLTGTRVGYDVMFIRNKNLKKTSPNGKQTSGGYVLLLCTVYTHCMSYWN